MLASPPSFASEPVPESRRRRSAEERYVEMTGRLAKIRGAGAVVIGVLVSLSRWGDQRVFVVLLGVHFLQVSFNAWVNLRLLRRVGPAKGEALRNAVNVTTLVITGHIAHWPLPVWFWLPYLALAFERLGARFATMTLALACVAVDGLALLEGAPPMYAIVFTLFALFCAQISGLRVREMSEMLSTGDLQRRELERAHQAMTDAHEKLTRETHARELVELELRQAQKLEAVGRLAAGIAHEVNTPIQFVGDNLRFTKDSIRELVSLIERYRTILASLNDGAPLSRATAEAAEAEGDVELVYLARELPLAVEKCLEGVERIAAIVRSVKDFARPEQREMTLVDMNDIVNNVLTIGRSEYAHVASVELSLTPLPRLVCHAGEMNHVVLNLLVNAAEAVGEMRAGTDARGHIVIRTGLEPDGKHVHLSIADDGPGIPEAIQRRIFEPFFTTKAVGKGTGQGLAVSRSAVHRHRGSLTFESKQGAGATFHVRLPVDENAVAGMAEIAEARR
ncbi:MAG TPA: ATP-binding protein [Polyangiaceae bacterium]|nr:ATP-binding protein [Polyangiaceae bacterium]